MKEPKDETIKKEILQEAQTMFKQFGLKKTTMDDIAAACGKGKSTLYHYFKNKEAVFSEVIRLELQTLRRVVKSNVDKAASVQDKLKTYFYTFHTEIITSVNLYRVLNHEIKVQAIGREQFEKVLEYEKSYVSRLLEDGLDSGELTTIEKSEIPFVSELIFAAFLGVVKYSVEKAGDFDCTKLKESTISIIPKLFI